jgi:hypothetical protein
LADNPCTSIVFKLGLEGDMTVNDNISSLVFALLLLACACFAGFDTFAFAFGIGDGGGQVGLTTGTLLIATLAGGVGLIIAAIGSWSRRPGISLLALISAFIVLPAAVLYGWGSVHVFWHNTKVGLHYSIWAWASAILPPFLCLVAAGTFPNTLQALPVGQVIGKFRAYRGAPIANPIAYDFRRLVP